MNRHPRLTTGAARPRWVSPILLFAALAALNLPAIGAVSNSPAPDWSAPTALSPVTQFSWFPDIAADATGRVHVVWSTSTSTGVGQAYDVVMYASSQGGAAWLNAQDIVALPSKGAVTRPTILADEQGLLHLTFRSYTVFYSHVPVQSVGPAALLPARSISTPDNGYFSRLAIDKQGRLHLVYTENIQSPSCTGCFHVFYRQSDDKGLTWSPAVDISRLADGAAKPQVVIDEAGNLHVVWEAGAGGDLGQLDQSFPTQAMYTASYDRGQTWTTPIELASFPRVAPTAILATNTPAVTPQRALPTATPAATPEVRSFKNIALGLGAKGQLVVAWLALPEDRVYFQVSGDQGRTWSDPQLIAGVWGAWTVYQGRTDDYAMVSDSAGVTHLLLVGRTEEKGTALSVLHVTWNGSSWGEPEAIATMTGDVPEWPRPAIGLGNDLHVVWFVRDQAHIFGSGGAAQYRIWYSHKLLAAPPLTPVVWPTLGPAIVASAAPSLTVSATPGPSLTPAVEILSTPSPLPNPNLVYNEMDYLKVVAKGLIPALLVIFLVVGAALLFRR